MNDFNSVERQEEEISLVELFGVVKPYIRLIVAISIVFALLSFLYTKVIIKPVYESSATLIVNNRKEEGNQSITNDEITSAKNLAAVYSIIIKSDAVMAPVVAETSTSLSTSQLASKVSVSAVNGTQVIKVSVRDTNPEKAKLYAEEIVTVAPQIIVDMVEAGSVKLVSNPHLPTNPISPNVKSNVLIAFALGAILSTGFVVVRHLLDRTFKAPEDVEKHLGIPVIGIIPNIASVSKGGK